MHLKYFGTAAAEGIPALFCTCPVCATARGRGGKELRTRSQALVDGRLLIDFPPDTYMHCLYGGLDLPAITACIITHSHEDHLLPDEFEYRRMGYAYEGDWEVPLKDPLRLYATAKAMERVRSKQALASAAAGVIEFHEIEAYVPFQVDDFTVTGLNSRHSPATGPVMYIIERAGKTMLYAHDTGPFLDEVWDYLARVKPRFGFVSLDCTGMAQDWEGSHMGLPNDAQVRDRLVDLGCADENTVFCAHHFSHNGGSNHEELVRAAAGYGFLVSYDGMEIEF